MPTNVYLRTGGKGLVPLEYQSFANEGELDAYI